MALYDWNRSGKKDAVDDFEDAEDYYDEHYEED